MQFTKIDINNWTRKEYFDHYFDNTPCTYSMTVKLDISKLKKDGKKLYPTLLYGVTTIFPYRFKCIMPFVMAFMFAVFWMNYKTC
jgi:chloramphenicol O-acetyltransferase